MTGINVFLARKFQPICACMLATQGGMEINSYEDFERIMDRFDSDAEYLSISSDLAGAYVKTKAGAADKVIKGVGL